MRIEPVDLTGDIMSKEENINTSIVKGNHTDCQITATKLITPRTKLGGLKAKIINLKRKTGSLLRFNLYVILSSATSMCLM